MYAFLKLLFSTCSLPNHRPFLFSFSDLFTIPNRTRTLPLRPPSAAVFLMLLVSCAALTYGTHLVVSFLIHIFLTRIVEIFNLAFVVPSIIWFLLLKLHHYTDMYNSFRHHFESMEESVHPIAIHPRRARARGFMLRKLFNIYHLYYQHKCDS